MTEDHPLTPLSMPPPLPLPVGEDLSAQLTELRTLVREQGQRIERLEAAIEQAVQLLLLPEADRAAFAQHKRYEQFEQIRRDVELRLSAGTFAELPAYEARLRQNFAADPEAQALLHTIADSRQRAATEAIASLGREVESLMSMGRWTDAFAQIDSMSHRFPGDVSLINLASRVQREHHGWRESVTTHLFEQVKLAIDRRDWGTALRHAEDLANRFADHPKAHRVVQQLPTLRENAEIAARQDLEQKMQLLIRARRYDEAIVLGEQIIRDYPHSPQAAECKSLVPRLEQLALQHETDESII